MKVHYCAFCGKSESVVGHLVRGPADTNICNECVELCNDVIAKKMESHPRPLSEFIAELRDQEPRS